MSAFLNLGWVASHSISKCAPSHALSSAHDGHGTYLPRVSLICCFNPLNAIFRYFYIISISAFSHYGWAPSNFIPKCAPRHPLSSAYDGHSKNPRRFSAISNFVTPYTQFFINFTILLWALSQIETGHHRISYQNVRQGILYPAHMTDVAKTSRDFPL